MTIVQINTVCGKGSTGRIAVDIANAALGRGHKCYIAYGYGSTSYPYAYPIGNRLEHLFHNLFFTRLLGLHGWGSIVSTLFFVRWLRKVRPDVVHIHNLHSNYINYRILFDYIIRNGIPLVVTLHDGFNFTGKCTYYTNAACSKWKTACEKCPLFRNTAAPSLLFDYSRFLFRDKKNLYQKIPKCHIVGVSNWIMNEGAQSILSAPSHTFGTIYNWVNFDVFKPASEAETESFRKKYGLSNQVKYLISVSQLWDKDSVRLADALKLSKMLPAGYQLLMVGELGKRVKLDSSVAYIPYISSAVELAAAYSFAEAYVHFSIADTFGLVIAEAMACGTIPITYDSTACGEIPGGFGILVQPRDVNAIIEALPSLTEKKLHREEMIAFVRKNYDQTENTNRYVDVYESMVADR